VLIVPEYYLGAVWTEGAYVLPLCRWSLRGRKNIEANLRNLVPYVDVAKEGEEFIATTSE
jgi:hypothetical protein